MKAFNFGVEYFFKQLLDEGHDMRKMILCLAVMLCLGACSRTPEDIKEHAQKLKQLDEENQKSIEHPVLVGKTANGVITRIHLRYLCDECYYPTDHYVYIVGGTMSDNYQVPSGKTTKGVVDVTINEASTPEQIIAEGERLKKVKEDAERQEYERLKLKFKEAP